MRLVLTNATLIDCVDPEPVAGAGVVVEDGRIVDIARGGRAPSTDGARVIDLDGAYLLPGLWDVHIHPEYVNDPNVTVARQTARFGQNLSRGLTEAGVVGVRTGGAGHFHGRGLARRIRLGRRGRPARVRERRVPHHHRRPLPHLRPRPRVRRTLRLRQRGSRADQERRGPHQAEPLRRRDGPVLGPSHPLLSAGGGADGGLRTKPPARLQGDGPRHQSGRGEGGAHPRRAHHRARLHHGRGVPRAIRGWRRVVRPHSRHHPPDALAGHFRAGEALGRAEEPGART